MMKNLKQLITYKNLARNWLEWWHILRVSFMWEETGVPGGNSRCLFIQYFKNIYTILYETIFEYSKNILNIFL